MTRLSRRRAAAHALTVALTIAFASCLAWLVFVVDTGRPLSILRWVRATPNADKVGHFALFGLLALGVNVSTRCHVVRIGGLRVSSGTCAVSLAVLLEELSQAWIPERTLDLADLLADGLGIAAGWWMARNLVTGPTITNARGRARASDPRDA